MTATNDIQSANDCASGHSLQRRVRRFPRRPGNGWKHMAGSVWEHTTGLRIHMLGLARLPDGTSLPWRWEDEYDAKRQQGYNTKRALMVWALTLIAPNVQTTENSQLQAFRKAQRFIESTKGLKPPKDLSHSQIKAVTYFGTIDA